MLKEKNLVTINQFSYIDTSIQKAGIPGFSGCIEYTSIISQAIKEEKKDKKNFAAVW